MFKYQHNKPPVECYLRRAWQIPSIFQFVKNVHQFWFWEKKRKTRFTQQPAPPQTCTHASQNAAHLKHEQTAVVEREKPRLPVLLVFRSQNHRYHGKIRRFRLAVPDFPESLLYRPPASRKHGLDLAVGVSNASWIDLYCRKLATATAAGGFATASIALFALAHDAGLKGQVGGRGMGV